MLKKWIKYWQQGGPPPDTDDLSASERKELDQMERLWKEAELPESRLKVDTAAAWNRMEDRLFGGAEMEETPIRALKPRRRKLAIPAWAAAAALVGVVLVAWWLLAGEETLIEPVWVAESNMEADARLVRLPDGSEVWINTESEIRFIEAFEERRVELNGEAFFDVVRDESRPFVVLTGGLETRVLGTSFNIRAYSEEEVEVSVKTGRVEVVVVEETTSVEKEKVVLNPGQAATYKGATEYLSEAVEAIVQVDAWRTEELVFGGSNISTIGDALATLSRFYHKNIEASPGFMHCPLVGTYQNIPLNELLEELELVFFDFSYVEDGETLTLSGSCD